VDAFPRNQRGQALGLNAVIVSLGVTVGPTLGGLITETLGWRFIFFVNVPLGLIGMVVAARVFAFSRGAARSRGFDLAGAATLGLGLASLSLGLSFGSEWGWTSPKLLLTLAVALVALAAGVAIELRRPNPLVEIRLLASRRMGLPLLSFLLSIFALFAVGFLLPFYFEQLRGWTPLVSGLMLSPYSVAFAITAPIAGRLADRSELPWLGPAGLALAAVGLALLARIGVSTSPLEIAVWLAISGVGQGMFLSPNTRAIMSSVAADQSGIPSGLIATTRVIGQGLSVAVAGAVFIGLGGATAGVALAAGGATTVVTDPSLDAAFLTAIHGALLVCALLAALGAVASVGRRLPEPTDALSNPGAQRASTSQRNEA
jgi:EmrB/QacA subfamily drug resistance transporter